VISPVGEVVRRSVAVLAWAFVCSIGLSADPVVVPAAERARAVALVKQLGDDSFDVRQKAGERLLEMGSAAEEALRGGLSHTDPEIRERCRRLLAQGQVARRENRIKAFLGEAAGKHEHDLPGWRDFARVAGDDAVSRPFYAEVFRTNADLLESADRDARAASTRLAERCAGLRLRLVTPGGDATALAEVTSLLVLAGDRRLKLEPASLVQLLDGLETFAERGALVKQLQGNAAAGKAILAFLQQERSAAEMERALNVAGALGVREAMSWALAVATDGKRPASARATALVVLSKVGDRTVLTRVQPILEETALVGTRMVAGMVLQAQLRDVALAVVIQLSGQNPADFGFPYLQAVPGLKTLPSPTCLGFVSDAGRNAAQAKWKASRKEPARNP
jgi:hypothetical protein